MIAKCSKCGLVRITRMRRTCPHCASRLARASGDELRTLADHAMERSRAARAMLSTAADDEHGRALRLAAFMSIFHGRNMTEGQAREALR